MSTNLIRKDTIYLSANALSIVRIRIDYCIFLILIKMR
jgi:hypothetical protein